MVVIEVRGRHICAEGELPRQVGRPSSRKEAGSLTGGISTGIPSLKRNSGEPMALCVFRVARECSELAFGISGSDGVLTVPWRDNGVDGRIWVRRKLNEN